jgi:hypothetical protein
LGKWAHDLTESGISLDPRIIKIQQVSNRHKSTKYGYIGRGFSSFAKNVLEISSPKNRENRLVINHERSYKK